MAYYRAQISFQLDSAFPRDAMTINPHYSGDDAQGLADRLKTNLAADATIGAQGMFTVKVYDAQKAPPSYPLAVATNGSAPSATTKPREVALCLSYYALWNRPGFRGRLYIPAGLIPGALDLRPTQAQRDSAARFVPILTSGMPAGTVWGVWSRQKQSFAQASNWWVDDEWDTMRSRGMKSTTRSTGTIP